MTKPVKPSQAKLAVKAISPSQQLALEVLLQGASDADAGKAAGVTGQTVGYWRRSSADFILAMEMARAEQFARVTAKIHASTTAAIEALNEVVKDTANPGPRVSAARAILEFSLRARWVAEIENRLEIPWLPTETRYRALRRKTDDAAIAAVDD